MAFKEDGEWTGQIRMGAEWPGEMKDWRWNGQNRCVSSAGGTPDLQTVCFGSQSSLGVFKKQPFDVVSLVYFAFISLAHGDIPQKNIT